MRLKRLLTLGAGVILIAALCLVRPHRAAAQAPATAPAAATPAGWQAVVDPRNAFGLWIVKDGRSVVRFSVIGWGPKWAGYAEPNSGAKGKNEHLSIGANFAPLDPKSVINLKEDATAGDGGSVVCKYVLTAKQDISLTMLALSFRVTHGSDKGQIVATLSDGTQKTAPLVNPRMDDFNPVSKLEFQDETVGTVTATFDPPLIVGMEGANPRVKLAGSAITGGDQTPVATFPAGTKTVTITLTAPGPIQFCSEWKDIAPYIKPIAGPDWFPFTPANDSGPSVIGMADWLDAPAGKHGGVRIVGDHFQFEDGTPIKFWGTNLAYTQGAPDKHWADIAADRFAKYGINAVRLHKFTSPGGMGIVDPMDATQSTPDGLDRLDYFTSRLKAKGIYFNFSHTYHFNPGPANAAQLLDANEVMKKMGGDTMGLINFAPDIQDLLIARVVNLLKHTNKYTHLTYAEEPALANIEIQNEDDIFWFDTAGALAKCPHYAKACSKRFCDWLTAKYGNADALAKAWPGALAADESLADGNIIVQGNPWFESDDHLPKSKVTPGERQRLLDNAAFLHSMQNEFYGRMAKAIRDAGYKGPICGSPWQAPAMLPELYNLKSDYLVGWIDRHNYASGGVDASNLSNVGGSYMTGGMQQVIDRPFGISEWIASYPAFYCADTPASFAAYGMGLQGWDSSYEFQSISTQPGFCPTLGPEPFGVWQVDTATQIGQFPALARMIYRGDVKEGDIIADRRVSPEALATGKFDFTDKVTVTGDVKNFASNVPARALAAGRVVVEFTDHDQPSLFPDMTKYTDGPATVSNTGQLRWDPTNRGYFTVNTDGTKAVVGFAQDKLITLGNVKITVNSYYASVFLTALDKSKTLADAPTALITAVARISNTDYRYSVLEGATFSGGKAPILMEPVKAEFSIAGRQVESVKVLDQDGRPTDQTLDVKDGTFGIDTGTQKTMYYEVVFSK